MKIFNWNSDPSKEVERELGAEFIRAVKIFYQDEQNRKEFEEYVRIKQGQVSGVEASLRAVSDVVQRVGETTTGA